MIRHVRREVEKKEKVTRKNLSKMNSSRESKPVHFLILLDDSPLEDSLLEDSLLEDSSLNFE